MTNDILEQIAEDYFRSEGYFTQHNVKYKPKRKGPQYAVHSDIDTLGIHPRKKGNGRVIVVSAKSWQGGINIPSVLNRLATNPKQIISGKEAWKSYRELVDEIWAKALQDEVKKNTGQSTFVFYLACTRYVGDAEAWNNFKLFRNNLRGCDIRIIDLKTMISVLYSKLSKTPSHSELTRLLQLIKASGGKIKYEE